MDCLFCKIANGEIPCKKLYEDENVLCFYDIEPQAPIHFLAITKKHIASLADIAANDAALIGHVFHVISTQAKELKLDNGYRVVTNCGKDGGQSVAHLHFHVLGARSLKWPPG